MVIFHWLLGSLFCKGMRQLASGLGGYLVSAEFLSWIIKHLQTLPRVPGGVRVPGSEPLLAEKVSGGLKRSAHGRPGDTRQVDAACSPARARCRRGGRVVVCLKGGPSPQSAEPAGPFPWSHGVLAFWCGEQTRERPLVLMKSRAGRGRGRPGALSPMGTAGHGLHALSVVSRSGFRDIHPSQTPGHPEMTLRSVLGRLGWGRHPR